MIRALIVLLLLAIVAGGAYLFYSGDWVWLALVLLGIGNPGGG